MSPLFSLIMQRSRKPNNEAYKLVPYLTAKTYHRTFKSSELLKWISIEEASYSLNGDTWDLTQLISDSTSLSWVDSEQCIYYFNHIVVKAQILNWFWDPPFQNVCPEEIPVQFIQEHLYFSEEPLVSIQKELN